MLIWADIAVGTQFIEGERTRFLLPILFHESEGIIWQGGPFSFGKTGELAARNQLARTALAAKDHWPELHDAVKWDLERNIA